MRPPSHPTPPRPAELDTPRDFALRLACARRAAEACTATGQARRGRELLAAAAAAPAPVALADALRRQPPSAVVAGALGALAEAGQPGLTAYLLKEPSIKVSGGRAGGVNGGRGCGCLLCGAFTLQY